MSLLFGQLFSKKVIEYKKNKQIFSKISKCLELFEKSPQHPSLRFHKLTIKNQNLYSISVDRSIRIICTFVNDAWYIVDIGTHDQVYRDK